MKKALYIFIVIVIIVLIIFLFIPGKHNIFNPKNTNTGTGNTSSGDTSTNTSSPTVKTLNDFVGQKINTKIDGTNLYDNDLNVVATYYAGEYIGWLGSEAKGYMCCKNQSHFYKIYDNPNITGFCQCEPLMSDQALKIIFGI